MHFYTLHYKKDLLLQGPESHIQYALSQIIIEIFVLLMIELKLELITIFRADQAKTLYIHSWKNYFLKTSKQFFNIFIDYLCSYLNLFCSILLNFMANQEAIGYIKLLSPVQPTPEQRNDENYRPKLKIEPEAMTILSEHFHSPISVLVYVGREGVGKSKLASLTATSLQETRYGHPVSPFRSSNNVKNVTEGIWMWRWPLKDPKNHKGSILLLDCEGISHLDETRSSYLYVFCMIISTAFTVILRPPRVDHGQCDRIHDALRYFEQIQAPSVLPNVWLVPLNLANLTNNDTIITPDAWIDRMFSLNDQDNTLPTNKIQRLRSRYSYIRSTLPNIDVVNIIRLPESLENDDINFDGLFMSIRDQSCQNYHSSLRYAIDQFLRTGGKRIPGSSSSLTYIRPAELAQFMSDLINVINGTTVVDPDQLFGKYLLVRFDVHIVPKMMEKFRQQLLLYVDRYAKENLHEKENSGSQAQTNRNLQEERDRLTAYYITKMKQLAEEQIYGRNSNLLNSNLFTARLNEVRNDMDSYNEPELLIQGIRSIHEQNVQGAQTIRDNMLKETQKKLDRFVESIQQEDLIEQSLEGKELQVQLEKCSKCFRSAGSFNLIHAKEDCVNSLGRHGNYYRYIYRQDHMVCDACKKLVRIPTSEVKCTVCGTVRNLLAIL